MKSQNIKRIYTMDEFKESVRKANNIIEYMQKELHLNRPLLKMVMDEEYGVDDAVEIFHGLNQSMNGAIGMIDKLTEPYVDDHETMVWQIRDKALAVYDEAREFYYEVQGRTIELDK